MSVAVLQDNAEIFARNRASGHVVVTAHAKGGISRRAHVHESGSLRARFPNTTDGSLEVVTINTAGGMTGGDRFGMEVSLGAGARMTFGTAAAEKIYRSLGPNTEIAVKLDVGKHASLAWLPQETILFDQARLDRRIDISLDDTASLVMCEGVVFGREAMGEAVAQGLYIDRWRLRRGGKLVFAETARLAGQIAKTLAQPASANGAIALATLLLVPGDEEMATKIRDLSFAGEAGVSVWNGLALVRFCARDSAALRHDIMQTLAALNLCALPRLWLS
ncbi:MAG: urease accessory protein UreD [Pseudolabrys sp.]|nr:urease accessory protein UreD [Pseudolabrys sp.]